MKELMEKFHVSKEADFYKVVRTYSLNGKVVQLATSYFDRRIVPFLSEEIAKKSIYEYLEKELKIKNILFSKRNKIQKKYR